MASHCSDTETSDIETQQLPRRSPRKLAPKLLTPSHITGISSDGKAYQVQIINIKITLTL